MDFKTQIKSTVKTGTAPLSVASTTVVTNLNADKLDGNDASAFAPQSTTYTKAETDTLLGAKAPTASPTLSSQVVLDGMFGGVRKGAVWQDANGFGLLSSDLNWAIRLPNGTNTVELLKGQLTFPATQNASADPNTLDDYEEGTFTPELSASTTDPTGILYNGLSGKYTKIGNQVTVHILIIVTAYSGGVGIPMIKGLPFVSSISNENAGFVGALHTTNIVYPSGKTSVNAIVGYNTNKVTLGISGSGLLSGFDDITVSVPSSGFNKWIVTTITYTTV